MQLLNVFAISLWLLSAWGSHSSGELVHFFNHRKSNGLTFSDDDLIDRAMNSKVLFFRAIGCRRGELTERLFLNAFILNRASFAKDLSSQEMEKLNISYGILQPFNELPRLLHTPMLRQQALQFFIHHPNFISGGPECYKVLLLLFDGCGKANHELTMQDLPHVFEGIKRLADQFKLLVVSMLNFSIEQGMRFCHNLWFYWTISQVIGDSFVVDILREAIKSSNAAEYDVLNECDKNLWAYPTFLIQSIQFLKHCDLKYARSCILKMIESCAEFKQWDNFKILMHQLPTHLHYRLLSIYNGPWETLAVGQTILDPRYRTIYLTELYLLSRFSKPPSLEVQQHMVSLVPGLRVFEPIDNNKIDWKGECKLPMEILLRILSQTDPITQLLAVPLVCKAWKVVLQQLLQISLPIHSLFMSDVGRCPINILDRPPWISIFASADKVVEYFAHTASISCIFPGEAGHLLLCEQYFAQLPSPNLNRYSSVVDLYVQEYIRLGVSIKWLDLETPPVLCQPAHMEMAQYGEVIRKLIRENSIVPHIPWDCALSKPVELYEAINDDEAFAMVLDTESSPGFDAVCAQILVKRISVPPGLNTLLSKYVKTFRDFFDSRISFPPSLDVLGSNPDLLVAILKAAVHDSKIYAHELLLHVLCCIQNDHVRISALTEALRAIQVHILSDYPIIYMLNNPQNYSTEQFLYVQRVILESGMCSEEELECLFINWRLQTGQNSELK